MRRTHTTQLCFRDELEGPCGDRWGSQSSIGQSLGRRLSKRTHDQIHPEKFCRLRQGRKQAGLTNATRWRDLSHDWSAADSDVNIEFAKVNKDAPNHLNYDQIKNMSLDIGSEVMVSSV